MANGQDVLTLWYIGKPMKKLLSISPLSAIVCIQLVCISLTMPFDVFARETTESQLKSEKGRFEVRLEKSVMIPMRDGTRLSTDLYFPIGGDKQLPTILVRDPYNKNRGRAKTPAQETYFFASHGYVVAKQDSRGKYESEGIYSPPHGHEATDGYDTVDWLSKQAWSNGKVGTTGCSYPGETQMLQAPLMHPNLAAMIPQGAGGVIGAANGKYNYWAGFKGGVLDHRAGMSWYATAGIKYSLKPPPGLSDEEVRQIRDFYEPNAIHVPEMDWDKLMWHLPLVDVMKEAGAPPNDWTKLVTAEFGDPWWHEEMGFYDGTEEFNVPALHMSSFYDLSVDDTAFAFNYFRDKSVSKRSADNQFLILAPTEHCGWDDATEHTTVGELDMGDTRKDWNGIYLQWFEHWLKDIDNGITGMPKVQYFVMGLNQWRSAAAWPLPEIDYQNFYLHSDGSANSVFGSGVLSKIKPTDEAPDLFTYDPGNPVPSIGGARDLPGARDQAEIEARDDVLVYTTKELDRGIEVTGPITLILYVSSTAKDTDFTAKLIDVYPDGRAYNVQDGILRVRYREGFTKKVWMEEGNTYRIELDMSITSRYFQPGHKIRLQVSSSNFPNFERNLNTGGNNFDESEWVIAENTIHHSDIYPSHLILPVIPEG